MPHFTNYAVIIADNEGAPGDQVVIGSISNVSTPVDNDLQYSQTAGTFYPEHLSLASVNPRSTFTTFDVQKMLEYIGLIGDNFRDATGVPPTIGYGIYQAKYDNGRRLATGHRLLRMPHVYGMNRQISVSHRQDATIDFEAMALWDKNNEPLAVDANVTLPALPASPGRWTLGGMQVGGIYFECLTDMTIDFGISPTLFGCDSDIHETKLNLDSVQPSVTFTCLDVESFGPAKALLDGLCGDHTDTIFYLRKRLDCGAGFQDDADPVHIRFTANGVLTISDAHSASGNQRAQIQYRLSCTWDGSNAPIIPAIGQPLSFP